MCWILAENVKDELSEYQYYNKIEKEDRNRNRNTKNYSPENYHYENIDEWESLAW